MVEFSPAILSHLVSCGYKNLKVENFKDYTVVEPLREKDLPEPFKENNAYAISIFGKQALEMTKRIFLLEMKFYIDERFIQ
jgi:hypothetical protein